jgi:hypothetical protein
MTWINIPEDWTGDQALAVVEFLDELSAAIWSTHELKMLDAWHDKQVITKQPATQYSQEAGMTTAATKGHLNTDDFPF